MDEYQDILYEVADGRARITLNRPEKHNAITERMQEELNDALWSADDDTRVHGVIIRGAGRSFCAGYDLTGFGGGGRRSEHRRGRRKFDDDAWHMERAQRLLMALFDMHKPTIAQVHGHCLAGGTGIAGLCDMVIAADDARFGFPPARDLGVLPINMWLYHVGPQWTKRLTITGDTVTGAEAAEIGLVLKAVPVDLLEAEVEQLADRLAHVDVDLLSANKRIVNIGLELMGARTLQRMAVEADARGHLAASVEGFGKAVAEAGLGEALRRRDAPFGDGRARVRGPETRDERGFLTDP